MGQALISQNCKDGSSTIENNGRYRASSNVFDGPFASATYANGVWMASGYDGLYYSTITREA